MTLLSIQTDTDFRKISGIVMEKLSPLHCIRGSVYVFGSQASGNPISYSDIDAAVILSEFADGSDYEKIHKADKNIMSDTDHHGLFVQSRFDYLDMRWSLHPVVFFGAVCLQGSPLVDFEFDHNQFKAKSKSDAFYVAKKAMTLSREVVNGASIGPRRAKEIMSMVFMLPPLFYQAKGNAFISKPDAISRFLSSPNFTPQSKATMDLLSDRRLEWVDVKVPQMSFVNIIKLCDEVIRKC